MFFYPRRRQAGSGYTFRRAVGICTRCGIGVCWQHGTRSAETAGRLLCDECAVHEVGAEWRPRAEADARPEPVTAF